MHRAQSDFVSSVVEGVLGSGASSADAHEKFELGPILDVIFILLIFLVVFIVSVTLNTEAADGVRLTLPEVSTDHRETLPGKERRAVISISRSGELHIDGNAISLEGMSQALKQLEDDTAIVLRGEADSDWQQVTEVIARIKEAGKKKLFLKLQPSKGGMSIE